MLADPTVDAELRQPVKAVESLLAGLQKALAGETKRPTDKGDFKPTLEKQPRFEASKSHPASLPSGALPASQTPGSASSSSSGPGVAPMTDVSIRVTSRDPKTMWVSNKKAKVEPPPIVTTGQSF